MGRPPSLLRGRVLVTSYLYEDPDHQDRVTSTVTTPEWTEDDRAALLGLEAYEATLCSGCGEPQHLAWHSEAEGWFETKAFVCHACTARNAGDQVVYHLPTQAPPAEKVATWPPFNIAKTVTTPDRKGGSDG